MKNYLLAVIGLVLISCGEEKKKAPLESFQQYHTITLSFEGPETSEKADENPF